MPTIEEPCMCHCPACLDGRHCGILDNDCGKPRSESLPEDRDEELWDDEMRASAGLLDPGTLGGSLYSGNEDDDDPEDE